MARTFAWAHFPCLSFSLAIAQFFWFISTLSAFGSSPFSVFLLCLFPTLLLHGLIPIGSLNFCVLSLAVV